MAQRRTRRRIAIGVTLTLALLIVTPAASSAATESLTVNLAATAGAVTGVGEGFLYGLSQDARVARCTVTRYRGTSRLPTPDGYVGDVPGWRSATIAAWRDASHGRGGGRR